MPSSVTVPSVLPAPSREKHCKLWFPDGDLVLSAPVFGSPVKLILYRIHRFIVTQNLPVLSDRLDSSMKDHDVDIELTLPDTADLIDILLLFLYDPLYMPFKHFAPTNPMLFYRLLHLCNAYKVTSLRARIIQFLEQEWPRSLIPWDQRERYICTLAARHPPAADGGIHNGPYLDDLLPEPAAVVRIARVYNIPSILPAALFELSRIDRHADRLKLHTQPHRQTKQSLAMLSAGVRSAHWIALLQEDHMCIHRGYDAMQRFLLHYFENAPGRCLLPTCMQGRAQLHARIWSESIKRRDVLSALQSVRDGHFLVACGVCSHCTVDLIAGITTTRETIFNNLGNFFGVAG